MHALQPITRCAYHARTHAHASTATQAVTGIQQSLSSLLTQSPRYFHNPRRVRGVGPRPGQQLGVERTQTVAKKRAALTEKLVSVAPIRSKVSVKLPQTKTLAPNIHSPAAVESFVPSPATFTVNVFSLRHGTAVGTETLPRDVFGVEVRTDILHRVVEWQRAGQRQGTAKTKDRAEVSGTGKKPHPQKGTGAARQGTKRGPHHYKGGVAHGKIPRDFSYQLPKKIRAMGVRVALTVKHLQGKLIVVQDTQIPSHKTKALLLTLRRLRIREFLLVHGEGELDPNMILAGRNLPNCDFIPVMGCNVLSLMRHPTVVITTRAIQEIRERLDRTSQRSRPIKFMVGSDGSGLTADQLLALPSTGGESAQTTAADLDNVNDNLKTPLDTQQQQSSA